MPLTRPRHETAEERRERKKAVKEERKVGVCVLDKMKVLTFILSVSLVPSVREEGYEAAVPL